MRTHLLRAVVVAVALAGCADDREASAQGSAVPVVQAPLFYSQRCAQCHDNPDESHAPSRDALRQRTPEAILAAMNTGRMMTQAEGLAPAMRQALAIYLSGRPLGSTGGGDASAMPNRCGARPPGHTQGKADWNGWGGSPANGRFQPVAAGLTAASVSRLTLKWVFGFPFAASAFSQPTVVGGRVYAGSDAAYVYSLDAVSGCVHWSYAVGAGVRTAISVGPLKGTSRHAVYFGDIQASVYALDAASGQLLWKQTADAHPFARITGAPTLHDGRLYVPVSSLEEMPGGDTKYPCCSFRGSVVAYDATTGKELWKAYAIADAPKPTKTTSTGVQLQGPSGGAIWAAPAVDARRGLLYVATGDAYSAPADQATDAIVAFDLKSGARRWVSQVTPRDIWLVGCSSGPPVAGRVRSETCPDELGPDHDFGSAVILARVDGRDLLFALQKSGVVWALDPDKGGKVIWQRRVAQGGAGGNQFGQAIEGAVGYFPSSDPRPQPEGAGITALTLTNGEVVWKAKPPCSPVVTPCSYAHSAAVSAIPGVLFAGTMDGVLRAWGTKDGRILWEYPTARAYTAINGVETRGGAMSGPGPTIADGMVFVNSGYSAIGGNGAGNALLAFSVD